MLQTILVSVGLLMPADVIAVFGPRTDAAVRKFQTLHGLTVDGIVGAGTWAALLQLAPAEMPIATGTTITVGDLVMPSRRCWPLRALKDGRKPVITSPHSLKDPDRKRHWGADLFYRYDPRVDAPMKVGDSGRTPKWFIPEGTWAIAQADGEVEIAGNSRTGYRLWISHEGGLRTGGFHFTELAVRRGDPVSLGQDLGIVGDNPVDTDPDHLHTELYRGAVDTRTYPAGTLDPERFWVGADVLPALP